MADRDWRFKRLLSTRLDAVDVAVCDLVSLSSWQGEPTSNILTEDEVNDINGFIVALQKMLARNAGEE